MVVAHLPKELSIPSQLNPGPRPAWSPCSTPYCRNRPPIAPVNMNHSLDNYECNDRLPCWAHHPLFSHKRVAQEPKFNLLGSLLARGLSGETLDISNRMCAAARSCFPIIRLQMNLRTMTIQVVGRRLSLSAPTSTILYS